jgi:hypothetical protein
MVELLVEIANTNRAKSRLAWPALRSGHPSVAIRPPQQKFLGQIQGTVGRSLTQDMNFVTFQDLHLLIQQDIKNNAFIRAV